MHNSVPALMATFSIHQNTYHHNVVFSYPLPIFIGPLLKHFRKLLCINHAFFSISAKLQLFYKIPKCTCAQFYKNGIRFGISLDLNKDGWNLEFNSNDLTMYAWNGTDFEPDPLFQISEFAQIPEEDPAVVNNVPCKLQMSSDGPLGRLFPDQMGVYILIEGFSVYNKPIWKHVSKPFYIRVDEAGDWFVTSVSW